MHFSDNTPNQQSKFRTKYWIEINDESQGTYKRSSWEHEEHTNWIWNVNAEVKFMWW